MVGLVPSSRVIVGEWATGLMLPAAAPSRTALSGVSELTSVVSIVIVGLHDLVSLGVSGQLVVEQLVVPKTALTLSAYQGPFCVDWQQMLSSAWIIGDREDANWHFSWGQDQEFAESVKCRAVGVSKLLGNACVLTRRAKWRR